MHLVTGWAPNARVKEAKELYLEAWERRRDDPLRAHAPSRPIIASVRQVVLAEADRNAHQIAETARDRWYASLEHLSERFGHRTMFVPPGYDQARRMGAIVAGTTDTVRDALGEHIAETGIDYLLLQFAFGEQEMRTLELFAKDVMPALS